MLVSMTGYGQGEASSRSGRVTVEIRTVNHRYLDLSIKMPKNLQHHEHEIKELLKGHIRRGRVAITITADTEVPEYDVKLNVPLMETYVTELRRFAKKHKLADDIDIKTIAGMPEIFHLQERDGESEKLWPLVRRSIGEAATALNRMREREGRTLEKDIRARITAIGKLVTRLEKQAPKVAAYHKQASRERLERLVEGHQVDEARFLTEAALMAERMDFTEEIIRLKSHMEQMTECLQAGGAISKRLTYLLQEVHRESTTIGSKAADAKVVADVVLLKEESERLREQVQNIE